MGSNITVNWGIFMRTKMNVKLLFRQISRHVRCSSTFSLCQSRTLTLWGSSKSNDWKTAVSEAEKIVGYPTSFMSLRCLLSDELANVALQIRKLVGTKHPLLKTAKGFLDNGKHSLQTRGLIVLLVAKSAGAREGSDDDQEMVSGIYPNQRTLAEITEMIHTANLVHKGVVNLCTLEPTDSTYKDMEFGNKIAVLSGDFLLANASTGLASLNNTLVVEIISQAIGDMMEAEFTELRDHHGNAHLPPAPSIIDWERQTYLQSGSLLSSSCQGALQLAGHETEFQQAAAKYGENIAYARQMHDDLQPFITSVNDNNGLLSSAPVIKHTELSTSHGLANDMNSTQIIECVKSGAAVNWCLDQCHHYGQLATSALNVFPASEAKHALINIVNATTNISTSNR